MSESKESVFPRYRSTRGWKGDGGGDGSGGVSFEDAVLRGLAPDGGLLVPTFFPQVSRGTLSSWAKRHARGEFSFVDLAHAIISQYIPESTVPSDDLRAAIEKSYGTFRSFPDVTPVVAVEGECCEVLELFHGPTFAFKDVALQFLGNLFECILGSRGRRGLANTMTVLGATSGDTGSSAIHGLRGKEGVEVFILFPNGKVSPIQERQMTTVLDSNVHCVAVEGTFDDCQAIVKSCFRDAAFNAAHRLGAVNSINWARILAQIVYYFYAFLRHCAANPAVDPDDVEVSFSVPTGNFGDILAGYYAKRMGLPVRHLIVATNDNDILHRFFSKGEYHKAGVRATCSPSMDICISSNFERFLFHMLDDNDDALLAMMTSFESTGKITAEGDFLERCRAQMKSNAVPEAQILSTMASVYASSGYLLDPHSAVGVASAKALCTDPDATGVRPSSPDAPLISLACAHWAKFEDAYTRALGQEAAAAKRERDMPPALAALSGMPTKRDVCAADVKSVQALVEKTLAA